MFNGILKCIVFLCSIAKLNIDSVAVEAELMGLGGV
jgi:hypothetical protein